MNCRDRDSGAKKLLQRSSVDAVLAAARESASVNVDDKRCRGRRLRPVEIEYMPLMLAVRDVLVGRRRLLGFLLLGEC